MPLFSHAYLPLSIHRVKIVPSADVDVRFICASGHTAAGKPGPIWGLCDVTLSASSLLTAILREPYQYHAAHVLPASTIKAVSYDLIDHRTVELRDTIHALPVSR
jgi:hypothetical protein